MKITADGHVYTDDGLHLGRVGADDVADSVANGTLKMDGDGGLSRASSSDHVCNCGCGRPISWFADFFSGNSAGATPECRKRIKESLPGVKQYLAENNLTVIGPSCGLQNPEELKEIKKRNAGKGK